MIFKLDRWATKDMFLLWKFEKLIKQKSCLFFFFLRVSGQRRECETRGVLHARGEGWEKVTSTNIFIFKTHERSCVSHSEERLKKKENFSCFSNTISNPPGAVVAFKFSAPFTLTIKLNYQLKQNTNINKHNQQTQYQTLLEPLLRLNSLLHLR